MQKEALYKQQLVELGMLREEEKQTFKRQEETQVLHSTKTSRGRCQYTHVKISQLVNKMCSQQGCSKLGNKL